MPRWRIALLSGLLSAVSLPGAPVELHVATTGDNGNAGTVALPLLTLAAARDRLRQTPHPEGATVWVHGGRYRLTETLTLGKEDSGAAGAPVVYRAAAGESVALDGGTALAPERLQPVRDAGLLARLKPLARGKVWVAELSAQERLVFRKPAKAYGLGPQLSFSGKMLRLARWPNRGYGHVGTRHDVGAVYAHGRTKGAPPASSLENPIGPEFSPREAFSELAATEFARTKSAWTQGYLSYDWYKTTDRIARIDGQRLKLQSYYRYDMSKSYEKIPRRFRILNLLCELDEPGEWYFDHTDSRLYLWPPAKLTPSTGISVWKLETLVALKDASHVTFRGFSLESAVRRAVEIDGGRDDLLAGCAVRTCGQGVQIKGGEHHGVVGCDFVDIGRYQLVLEGGTASPTEITPARHYAENNHFRQERHDGDRAVRIRGVGNVFRHNLVHDFPGEAIVYSGNDHLMELNEIYRVKIEEGDGGATYCGAQMWSYGNVLRYNFYHHLLCIPQAHPVGGLYLDDLDAGEKVYGNVFYKGGHRAVLVNGGAANHVENNLFLAGHIGIYCTSAYADKTRRMAADYASGKLRRGDKMDHLWRTEQVVGVKGWDRPLWAEKYPLFHKVMSSDPYSPIECRFVGNLFHGNVQEFSFRTGWGKTDTCHPKEIPYVITKDNAAVDLGIFMDPAALDFQVKAGVKLAHGIQAIPFAKIGLYLDEYRTAMPDKRTYRSAVRARFANRAAFDEKAVYDPATINALMYPEP
jgi:hypothetical protein